MRFHVLTIFPDFVRSVFNYGVLRRGCDAGLISHDVRDLRDFTDDRHRSTDDMPFGGGPGMVMLAEPIFRAVEGLRAERSTALPLIMLTPSGQQFSHGVACELAAGPDFILLCGRYEGVDQRVLDHLVDREVSIGDYVLSGGEIPAMVVIDAVARQIAGVVGNEASYSEESFARGLLDWPHYTRPEDFRGWKVPSVLLSGHHAKISSYREEQGLLLTYRRRPDLLSADQLARARALHAKYTEQGPQDGRDEEGNGVNP
jgi:tRNA (guanine37-N1)-methyltransferase